jgi:hypothetical protein
MVKHMLDIYDLLKKANFASESNYMSYSVFPIVWQALGKTTIKRINNQHSVRRGAFLCIWRQK